MDVKKIKISRRPDLVYGVFVKDFDNWLLIEENIVDYVLDGFSIINKKYIKSVLEAFKKDSFESKVFINKIVLESYNKYLSIDDIIMFLNNSKKAIGIELESSSYTLVGKINKLNDDFLILDMYSSKGKFLEETKIKFSTIRKINFDTDYLKSIESFLVK